MKYDVLAFLQALLKRVKISCTVLHLPYTGDDYFDWELRKNLYYAESTSEIYKMDFSNHLLYVYQNYLLCWCMDRFGCEYILMRLPDENNQPTMLMCGPFSCTPFDEERILQLCLQANVPSTHDEFMKQYYATLPVLSSSTWIESIFSITAETIWPEETCTFHYIHDTSCCDQKLPASAISATSSIIEYMEQKYHSEDLLMGCIATGDTVRMAEMLPHLKLSVIKQHFPDSIRDYKDKLIIFNTICRRAAKHGGVHPVYIDREFNRFESAIEYAENMAQLETLYREIPQRYCTLCRELAVQNCAPIIQEIITYIQFNLTEDLSLDALARQFSLNKNYLCTLFKKDTGKSLTTYVNTHRIEHALYLLSTTTLSIKDVACHSGINDLNYFYRLFQKHTGVSPKKFRENHLQHKS